MRDVWTAMTGQPCHNHVATSIRGRTPLLCRRYVASFALACPECGGEAPAVKLGRYVKNAVTRVGVIGDVEKAGHARRTTT